jgi:hypothetical protein
MKFTKSPIALAALAMLAGTPLAAQAISVSFNAPSSGAVLTNVTFNQTSACQVSGSDIRRVVFSLVSSSGQTTALNTETGSPWQCNLNSRNFADGSYTLRAVAYDSANRSATATRPVTIRNQTTDANPTISFSSPRANQTIGSVTGCQVSASDDRGVKQVQFFMDDVLIGTDTTSAYQCSIDNKKYTNGAHTLKAVVTDSANKTAEARLTINITGGIGTTPPTNPPANPAPVVSFKSPANGTKLASGASLNTCEVNATDANGIDKIEFYMNNTLYVTEKIAPYTCGFGSGKFADGSYTLKAVATDKLGAKAETQISLTIGSGSTNPPADTTPPSVSISAPGTGTKLTGATTAYTATASDNTAVTKVEMVLKSGATEKVVDTKTSAPYSGTLNTAGLPNGPAVLMARATDSAGLTSTVQRDVTIDNTVTPPTDPNPNPGPGTGTALPSTNAKGVATFESLGMYWKPGSAPSGGSCNIRYRKHTETAWKEALPMWYDSRDSECRGSIVHLAPGTDYAVEMGANGSYTAGVNIKTWSESFPIAQTINVPSGSQTLRITQGGTKDGYVLYTGATLDAANGVDYNIEISAPYVIIRGFTLKGARRNGIELKQGAKDVVIEDNDISGWGRQGVDRDSAVNANCPGWTNPLERIVVQRNKMHHPRYDANSWDGNVHPAGAQAVTFNTCGGNHVLRYNEVYSTDGGNYFNDGFSGGPNYSATGFPLADTDIYGNRISHTRDDAIEAEGSNKNNRIWGNYLDQNAVGIASTVVHNGPLYIFRNVHNRNRQRWQVSIDDSQSRSSFFKAGMGNGFGNGRRYVFHNTMLQATQSGVSSNLGAAIGLQGNSGQPLTNTMSRNNIFHVWRSGAVSIGQHSGSVNNDLDYDLFNGALSSISGMERNGKVGVPTYAAGHGWQAWGNGNYQLQAGSLGHDQGARLPNFNDGFTGSAPDMGAHESGTPAMKLGVSGSTEQWSTAGSSSSSSSSASVSTGGTGGTTTASSGEVCSTALCVLGQ